MASFQDIMKLQPLHNPGHKYQSRLYLEFQGISTDKKRLAVRSGRGAVVGSKKIKTVVAKGTGNISIADLERIKETQKKNFIPFPQSIFQEGLSDFIGCCTGYRDVA